MNKKFKNIVVLVLAFAFVSASVFCCCISDTAQASEAIPECHQTDHKTHDSSQDHNSEDCDCFNIISITIEKANSHFELTKTLFGLVPPSYLEYILFVPTTIAYQAPPIVYDTLPLYIKHSILRI